MIPGRLTAESKLALALLGLGALAGAVGAGLVSRAFEERVEAVGATLLAGASEAFRAQQAAEVGKLGATLDALLASRELQAAFVKRDREGLQRLAGPVLDGLRARHQITHWYFHLPGPEGRVFLRVHRPGLHGEPVNRITLRRAADSGKEGAGLELGRTAFALRVVRPWMVDGKLIGYMELAEEVDRFLAVLKDRTGDEYGLLVPKRFINEQAWADVLGPRINSWNARPDVLVVDTSDFTDGVAAFDGDVDRLPEAGRFLGATERAGRAFTRGVFPIDDAGGHRVAALYVVHDLTAQFEAMHVVRARAFAILLALGLLAAAVAVALARLLVFRRLSTLRALMERRVDGGPPSGAAGRMSHRDDLDRIEGLVGRALESPPRLPGASPGPPGPGPRPPGA
jgi:Double sensory domain of two-component sensor kinase